MAEIFKSETQDTLYRGLNASARERLETRSYAQQDLASRVAVSGASASELVDQDKTAPFWIPGVEVFSRRVFQQRHRGHFAEFARQHDGRAAEIGLWPQQWAAATMFTGTAKGFHIHPPAIPEDQAPAAWFQKLYIDEPDNYALRPYGLEQWDMMFFARGIAEMFLVDEREGMQRRKMRFIIEGDDMPGSNNVGVIIPPGVAHAIRCAGPVDLMMVYGTTTPFDPAAEGRIASGIEQADLPTEWADYFSS